MFLWLNALCLYPMCTFGPDFWGLVSREWRLCRLGRLQSPVNIDPRRLLFDPHLTPLAVAQQSVEGKFQNTGQFLVLTAHAPNVSDADASASHGGDAPSAIVNISGGPAYPYNYQLHQVILHFGRVPSRKAAATTAAGATGQSHHQKLGSEHTVDQIRFPAEIQMLAFNSDLYNNFSEAVSQPRGLLAIAVIVDIGDETNSELQRLVVASQSIAYKHRETHIRRFDAAALLPPTEHYVTYDGSLTFPGCQEGVTWVIMNSPIYITREELEMLNQMQQREEKDDAQQQPLPMSGNYRPLRPLNGRLIRTNINVKYKSRVAGSCPSNIYLDMGYRANPNPKRRAGRHNSIALATRHDTEASKAAVAEKIAAELAAKSRKSRAAVDSDDDALDRADAAARWTNDIFSDNERANFLALRFVHDDESSVFDF